MPLLGRFMTSLANLLSEACPLPAKTSQDSHSPRHSHSHSRAHCLRPLRSASPPTFCELSRPRPPACLLRVLAGFGNLCDQKDTLQAFVGSERICFFMPTSAMLDALIARPLSTRVEGDFLPHLTGPGPSERAQATVNRYRS